MMTALELCELPTVHTTVHTKGASGHSSNKGRRERVIQRNTNRPAASHMETHLHQEAYRNMETNPWKSSSNSHLATEPLALRMKPTHNVAFLQLQHEKLTRHRLQHRRRDLCVVGEVGFSYLVSRT